MSKKVDEVYITWPARWFRILWWFPHRYLFFFFTIPGVLIAANFLPKLFVNSPGDPEYLVILRSTDIAILGGSLIFPLLGLMGYSMIGHINRYVVSMAIPIAVGAIGPFFVAVPLAELWKAYRGDGQWQLGWRDVLFDAEILLPVVGPVAIAVCLFLLGLTFRAHGRMWRPFRRDDLFLTNFSETNAARLKFFVLTLLLGGVCALVWVALALWGDRLLTAYLSPSHHPASNLFVWYSTKDPQVSSGYFHLLFSSPSASALFLSNLVWMAIAVLLAVLLFRLGLRFIRLYHARVWSSDPRPPVLLLRSFRDDAATVWPTAIFRQLTRRRYRLEEAVVESLADLGPVVAIGQPGEQLPRLGAFRESIADADWQARVVELMDRSQLIVLIAGTTDWVRWELNQVLRNGHQGKLITIFPNLAAHEKTARMTLVAETFAEAGLANISHDRNVSDLLLLHTLPDGEAIHVMSAGKKQSDYELASRLAVIQKGDAGQSLGASGNAARDARNVKRSAAFHGTLLALAWTLALIILAIAVIRPTWSNVMTATCDNLVGAPWDAGSGGAVEFNAIKPGQAIASCSEELKRTPGDTRITFHLGRAYHAAGRIAEARTHYEAAAEAGYPAAMNSLGLMITESGHQGDIARQEEGLHWLREAMKAGIPDAALGISHFYSARKDIDISGRMAAGYLLMAVAAGTHGARAQLIGGLRPWGFGDHVIKSLEEILFDFGLQSEAPDTEFTFETLQSTAVFFSKEVGFDLKSGCLVLRSRRQCFMPATAPPGTVKK